MFHVDEKARLKSRVHLLIEPGKLMVAIYILAFSKKSLNTLTNRSQRNFNPSLSLSRLETALHATQTWNKSRKWLGLLEKFQRSDTPVENLVQ